MSYEPILHPFRMESKVELVCVAAMSTEDCTRWDKVHGFIIHKKVLQLAAGLFLCAIYRILLKIEKIWSKLSNIKQKTRKNDENQTVD